ncbi:MAG: Fe-S cluster assembly protein HesB [uncultured Thiotrichaceae bacterium]|uniref:Fe-S cluster assembly protein HesB n=1 Tax=uncultured Thiotrichaceae bacterium TaxID=298394 RepID=A0A6S6U8W5_9GAMM|nr:MAG: Fe-S cluster assembly protein HesB [uncultured Thiotrichaceae bacterium]
MMTVTPAAVEQISAARKQSNCESMPLRIAVQAKTDGSLHYVMGFDDDKKPGDFVLEAEGVNLVVDQASQPLANGMSLDFVELEGTMEFIFINPNDPKQTPVNG